MNRRGFLAFLSVAPVAVPMSAYAMAAASEGADISEALLAAVHSQQDVMEENAGLLADLLTPECDVPDA